MDTTDKNLGPEAMAPNPRVQDIATEFHEITAEEISSTDKTPGKPSTPFQDAMRHFQRDTRAMVCLCILGFIVLLAIFGPMIYIHIGGPFNSPDNGVIGPEVYHNFTHQELSRTDEGPSAMYWLGTDSIGRDQLARLMQGLRISFMVAILVEIITDILGISVGILAGYYGGWVDQFLARFVDVMFAFPGLLFTILVAGIFGTVADSAFSHVPIIGANGSARLVLVGITLAVVSWPVLARLVRGQTLQLKEQQFIEAAKTSGTRDLGILMRHIFPNLFAIIIVTISFDIPTTIVAEAGLSFLGLGVQPPGASVGIMILDGSNVIDTHPWEVLLPAITLTILVLTLSFIGDGLRDA
ncbi:MAG TPA: ABC transporter permease, partial [Ktedonobacteraceae bacterium]